MVPAPAINGKANGTMEAVDDTSSLKTLIPNIISMAIINITSEPAMANDGISKPITLSSSSPTNRKMIISTNTAMEAFSDSMWPIRCRISIIIGIAPKISMIAKRIIVTDNICRGSRVNIGLVVIDYPGHAAGNLLKTR